MLCRLENIENGRTKFISLPKSERRIAAYLVDIGVTFETEASFRISYIGTKRAELGRQMMEMGLSIEELNLVAEYMFDKTEYWEECFELLLKAFNPKTPKDFINLMYESLAYQFYDATNDEELGMVVKKLVEEQDEFTKGLLEGCKGKSDKEIGQIYRMCSKGEYLNFGKFMIKHELSDEEREAPEYDGVNTNREWYEFDDDPYCMCEINVADNKNISKYVGKGNDKIPFLKLKFPMTMNEIQRSIRAINAEEIVYIVSDEGVMFPEDGVRRMTLWEINELAEIWEDLYRKDYQIDKFWAIMTYEDRTTTFDDILECVMNMHNYRYYPGVQDHFEISNAIQIKKRFLHNDPKQQRLCSKAEIVTELMKEFNGKVLKHFGILLCTNGEKGFEEYYEVKCV